MKKNFIYMAALAMLAVACNKNENDLLQNTDEPVVPEVKMITETITAINGDNSASTRADVDASAVFTWSNGDQIAVHVSDGKYYTTEDFTSGGSNGATFTVSYPEGESRDAFAVFPASIVAADATNYGQESAVLDVTLPASYTLAQVSGTTTPCPMIAANEAGSGWTFSQLCAMLRLTVNCIPPSTSYLEIDFNGCKVQGAFSLASPVTPGTSVIATSATTGTDDIITITDLGISGWTDGMVLNLPLPTGNYTDVTVTAYNSSNAAVLAITSPLKASGTYTAARAKGRMVTASMPVLSVSAEKKVLFAPGNLQYFGNPDGSGTWRFAEHQYDFMGDGPTSGTDYQGNVTVSGYTKYNASADLDVARDLFGWGTSGYNNKYPYMTSTSSGSYYSGSLTDTDYDWGVYHRTSGNSDEKISKSKGGDYPWRLFTSDEWAYIIAREGRVYTRTDALNYQETKALFASATVVGVKGLILFPDKWTGALDRSIKYGNANEAGYDKTICDAEKWAKFEKEGCVFLPAAHVRRGVEMSYLNEGHYWASTVFSVLNNTEYRGGTLEFSNKGTVTRSSTNCWVRYLGQSVRLIREVE